MKGPVKGSVKGSVKDSVNREETAMPILRAMSEVEDRYIERTIRFREKEQRRGKAGSRVRQLSLYGRVFAAAACVILAFTGYYAVKRQAAGPEREAVTGGVPYLEVSSLEEAEEAAGFRMTVPETVLSGERVSIVVYDGNMIQVTYGTEDGAETVCCIRKAEGTEDISGDYNEYTEVTTKILHGREVTLKGNDGTVSLAVWAADGYSYAVGLGDLTMTAEEMTEIIEDVE